MRKTAILLFAILALTAGLWASVQPVRLPCPMMPKVAGRNAPGPCPVKCPMKDCCRIAAPESLPAALVAAPARVKPVVVFLPPIVLTLQAVLPPAARTPSPADELIRPRDLPPPPLLIPLRI